jgi:hypothetical protein
VTVRRGQGYTLSVSTTPAVHRRLLARCQPLDGSPAIPAQRKARREYEIPRQRLRGRRSILKGVQDRSPERHRATRHLVAAIAVTGKVRQVIRWPVFRLAL